MLKFILLFCSAIFCSSLLFGQVKTYDDLLKGVINAPELKNASISLYAEKLSDNKVVMQHNQLMSVVPASTFKIIPTATALELLGANYKFKTELAYSGAIATDGTLTGNIYIIGYGDPCLGSSNFSDNYNKPKDLIQQWVDAIKALGIKKVNGDIISDISYFGDIDFPDTWIWEDIANYYGNPGSALNYMDNLFKIHFKTGYTDGSPTIVTRTEPADIGLTFTNKVTSSSTTGDEAFIYFDEKSGNREIRGTLPWKNTDFTIKGSIPEPELYLAKVLTNSMKVSGISVSGEQSVISDFDNSKIRKVFHTTYSPSLSDIVMKTNMVSFNLYAEVLSHHIAIKLGKSYSESILSFWKSKAVDVDGLNIEDACGLSHFNSINAKQMVSILRYMRNQGTERIAFYNSLPVAGTSGTLSRYCVGTKAQNRLHAKSGSMTRVRSYAGYIFNEKGEEIVFCLIVNNYNCNNYRMRKICEDLFIGISEISE
jgi:D-alanyl-D-alanine carboxypeptidase/D-alanyl-D-alanine-endopeptidase (penicillin-binding protein 4)